MNEKSKKFALIGDMAGLLGFVSGCSGIACGILERYQAAVILLGGGALMLAVAMSAYRGIRRRMELVMDGGMEEPEHEMSLY
ncbi:MAG: hypothetical protein Q4G01_01785 [Eubacteriales bacterium]|nr:hypothetical protein [Eubacteriales bacterium]